MSAATSPGTGLAYGLRRVCAAWGMARSSFYAMTSGQHAEQPPAKRRGPKPAISDQALLVAIEADLEASPWEGEGYRKVWARLRVCRDIRVARKRVLRLMRENNLLSPHRCRRRGGNPHDGEIITHAPNLMWGTDGVRVFTVDDGWGWIFTAVEHWNAECVGWHVCKRGDRFAALQPISMGLAGLYGSTAAGAARGLALRMDHGSQYLSDHFTNQIKFWGHPAVLRLRRRAPDQRRRRAVQSHAEGTDHPWSHLPQHRGAAGRRPRLRRTLQCPVDRRKERLPEPRSSSSGVARRDLNQARRVRQTCVQGTGCATACQKGLTVGFITAAALVHELIEARDEKRLLRFQKQLAKYKLLIIDELGFVPLSKTGAELLFEVFSQRYEGGSTLVTSNLPFDEWTEVFGSERLTGALLDRLTHHVHILEMNGDSYRLNQSQKRRKPPKT